MSLSLTGFILVSLPLIVALVSSIQILDNVAQQSAVAVLRSVNRIEGSKKIMELLQQQEQEVRLFQTFKGRASLVKINEIHNDLVSIFHQFDTLRTDDKLSTLVQTLQQKEQILITQLNVGFSQTDLPQNTLDNALATLQDLNRLTVQVERLSSKLMIQEADLMRQQVQQNEAALIWQVAGLIIFCVLLMILFIKLLVRPVYQMDQGIEQLGEGDFNTPIAVSGPRDLETIGKRLDWLRKRLNILDREKLKMLAHVSHELKTPLTAIREGTGLLKEEVVGPLTPRQSEVVKILDGSCRKLQKLIQNILDFNMAQAREQPVLSAPLRLDEIIGEVIGEHQPALLSRHLQLNTRLSPILVAAPREQLAVVIDNLLSNAIKFTPDGGKISLAIRKKERRAHLIIEDSGPGIDEEDRPQVFLPFFQGKQHNFSSMKGSGLGLAISREYLQNFGGNLRLLPRKKDRGAKFWATIPIAPSEQ